MTMQKQTNLCQASLLGNSSQRVSANTYSYNTLTNMQRQPLFSVHVKQVQKLSSTCKYICTRILKILFDHTYNTPQFNAHAYSITNNEINTSRSKPLRVMIHVFSQRT
jgi:hypothetical protein